MRQMWLFVALTGAGCNSLLGIDELTVVDADTTTDGAIDAPGGPIDAIDSPMGNICAMLVTPARCFSPPPTGMITLDAVNTETDARCVTVTPTSGPALCAIVADTITIAGPGSIITGNRPLLLLATTTIRVTGVLDASSLEGTTRIGPGASTIPAECGPLPVAGAGNDGGGGGAGGSFSTKGGDGGDGGGNGGSGGANANSAQVPVFLRPGCSGSPGGRTNSGPGGYGGGGLYLVAGTSIEITNRVLANGAGGTGATSGEAGGGGGGSGGMIALEAPSITMIGAQAEISANGGGGGEGTVIANAGEGGQSAAWNLVALGGSGGSTNGGNGGNGSTRTTLAEDGVNGAAGGEGNDGGGGGGGGGLGVIWLKGSTPTGAQANQISPAPLAK